MNINFAGMKLLFTRTTGRTALLAQKHAPTILIIGGTIGIATSAIMAYKATLKAEDVLDRAKEKLEAIRYVADNMPKETYSKKDYQKDLALVYYQTGIKFVQLYGPAVLLGTASVAAIWGSHHILTQRNSALMAAYAALDKGFSDYRSRVVNELGADQDHHFRYNTKKVITEEKVVDPETGKTKKVKTEDTIYDPNALSVYSKMYDETCKPIWTENAEYNYFHLRAQQEYWNNILHSRGFVFLNEVYASLGIEPTQIGQKVGWWLNKEGDNYICFNFLEGQTPSAKKFLAGKQPEVLLDFNVDGIIYQFLEKK